MVTPFLPRSRKCTDNEPILCGRVLCSYHNANALCNQYDFQMMQDIPKAKILENYDVKVELSINPLFTGLKYNLGGYFCHCLYFGA